MSEWTGGDRINLGPSGAIAAVDYSVRRFAELGVTVAPGNRLESGRRLLERVNARELQLTREDESLLRRVTEAQWAALNFQLIARSTGNYVGQDYLDKVALALGGTDLPETDRNHLHRNTEFELLAAAMLAMGDIPVRLAEPDLRIVLVEEELGVAAKRVQSSAALDRRMKEAAAQIRASGIRGLIAVNADVILLGAAPIGDAVTKGETIDQKISRLHELDDKLIHESSVVGRIAFGRTARWDFDESDKPVLQLDMFRQYCIYGRGTGDSEAFERALAAAEAIIDDRLGRL